MGYKKNVDLPWDCSIHYSRKVIISDHYNFINFENAEITCKNSYEIVFPTALVNHI